MVNSFSFFMALPFFYNSAIHAGTSQLVMDEDTSRHVVQVLRMSVAEKLLLTDGKGNLFTVELTDANKKKATVKVLSTDFKPASDKKIFIAISLVKNASRFEWFLEKAAEIGVSGIIPLICARTEKQHFRYDRMKGILVSAMLQSQQPWLAALPEPVSFDNFFKEGNFPSAKYIAHCVDDKAKVQLAGIHTTGSSIILVGPEGDFTADEIDLAIKSGFVPVALGETRLRTETAGIAAAVLLCNS